MKKAISILSCFFLLITWCSCQEKKSEMINIIIQPEVELNKKMNITLYFKELPDEDTVKIDSIKGLNISQFNLHGGFYYSLGTIDTYAIPTKTGKIEFPPISINIKGVEYKSKPFSINVVNNIKLDSNSVRMVLESDKSTYQLYDTINITLYQYSKFSRTSYRMTGEEPESLMTTMETLNEMSGIPNLEEYIDENFEYIDFKWGFPYRQITMKKLSGENYIMEKIFSIKILANKEGKYTIQPSTFDFFIYKNDDDYYMDYLKKFIDEGPGKKPERLRVTSNSLEIKVQ